MVTTTMQERAAKVADALDGPLTLGSSSAVLDTERLTARTIAAGIRALDPDPTRAALEECGDRIRKLLDAVVPAIGQLTLHQKQLDMDGCMVGVSRQAVDEVCEVLNDISLALSATVRNALQGE